MKKLILWAILWFAIGCCFPMKVKAKEFDYGNCEVRDSYQLYPGTWLVCTGNYRFQAINLQEVTPGKKLRELYK